MDRKRSQNKKPSRRQFSLREGLLYVLLVNVAVFGIQSMIIYDRDYYYYSPMVSHIGNVIFFMLALTAAGIGVAFLAFGRRYVIVRGVMIAGVIYMLLLIAVIITFSAHKVDATVGASWEFGVVDGSIGDRDISPICQLEQLRVLTIAGPWQVSDTQLEECKRAGAKGPCGIALVKASYSSVT